MILHLALACAREHPRADGDTDVDTSSVGSPTATVPLPPAHQLGVADADLTLPDEMFAGFWAGFFVVGDLADDGADDVVGISAEELDLFYEDPTRVGFVVWPDVLDGAPMWTLKSPAFLVNNYAKFEGVTGLASTPDVTEDGVADAWVSDMSDGTYLLPGPVDRAVSDPAPRSVAVLTDWLTGTMDLDRDGVGEVLLTLYGPGRLAHCRGPFAGIVDADACDQLVPPGWQGVGVQGVSDLDGDGIDDLLVAVTDPDEPGPDFPAQSALLVVDGTSLAGAQEPLVTIAPEITRYFNNNYQRRAAFADIDGDGHGDVAWVEIADYQGLPGEVAVAHGPFVIGADLGLVDATLHLDGAGSDAFIAGAARRPDGAAWLVLDHQPLGAGAPEALTPFLVDGTLRGTVDPAETAEFLASDGVLDAYGYRSSEAHVGDFDGDAVGDVLVVDTSGGGGAWIYLGANLPVP
jgi:hypothetical protein